MPNPTPESEIRAVQHLQKAHRCAIVDASWVNDNDSCLQVIELSVELANGTHNNLVKFGFVSSLFCFTIITTIFLFQFQ